MYSIYEKLFIVVTIPVYLWTCLWWLSKLAQLWQWISTMDNYCMINLKFISYLCTKCVKLNTFQQWTFLCQLNTENKHFLVSYMFNMLNSWRKEKVTMRLYTTESRSLLIKFNFEYWYFVLNNLYFSTSSFGLFLKEFVLTKSELR